MYTLMSYLTQMQARFVIRSRHMRSGAQTLAASNAAIERVIEINARIHKTKGHLGQPPREAREAKIVVTAKRVNVMRPMTDSKLKHPPEPSITLNYVHVTERDVPEGQVPIEWMLWTSEPIETEKDLARIIDIYRARWMIEEFFKALKSGCAYEERQLESKDTLLTALALLLPIAYQLLAIRTLAASCPNAPADEVVSKSQLAVLKNHRGTKNMALLTAHDALLAIARLGGHLKRNGPPGWSILYRGFTELLQLETGYNLAFSSMTCDLS